MSAGTLSKTAKMIRRGRIILIGGQRLRVAEPPVTVEDPILGTLYVFTCTADDDSEVVVRRSPNARIEVER